MRTHKTWLVVKADGSMRLRSRRPAGQLAADEVAVEINVHMPDGWGRVVQGMIDVVMPDPPEIGPIGVPILAEPEAVTHEAGV